MAVSMADITKLRKMTGAGMMEKVACWQNQLVTTLQ